MTATLTTRVLILCAVAFGQPSQAGVDLPMLDRGREPAIAVRVNGEGPFLFAIDTGGSGTARIDHSLADHLKLEQIGEARASDGSGSKVVTMPVMKIDSLEIGPLRLADVHAPSRDYNHTSNPPHIDGILGLRAFSGYVLTLDFPHQKVILGTEALPEADGHTILDFDMSRGVPVVQIGIGGTSVDAILDTGNVSTDGILLPASLADRLELTSPPIPAGTARTVTGAVELETARLRGAIRIGEQVLADPDVVFSNQVRTANIGAAVLRKFTVSFDQQNHRVKFIR